MLLSRGSYELRKARQGPEVVQAFELTEKRREMKKKRRSKEETFLTGPSPEIIGIKILILLGDVPLKGECERRKDEDEKSTVQERVSERMEAVSKRYIAFGKEQRRSRRECFVLGSQERIDETRRDESRPTPLNTPRQDRVESSLRPTSAQCSPSSHSFSAPSLLLLASLQRPAIISIIFAGSRLVFATIDSSD